MIRAPFAFCLACALAASTQLQAHTATLSHGHVDVGVGYEAGEWDLHVHDEERDIEYEPDEVVLEVHEHGMRKVPDDPRYGFLGKAGRPIWVLPEVEDHDLLFLGLAAEEVETGVFVDDQITLSLKSVTGPGEFFLYHTDALGTPVVSMNSADGIDEGDARTLVAGSHSHVNWVFTSPGSYRIGLQASGVLTSDGSVSTSEIAEYRFEVEPARLSGGHVDVGVAFEDGEWELHVHDEETDTEFGPGQVVMTVPGRAVQKVPQDPGFAFLGTAGSPVWVLPEVEDHNLLFLGLAAEEVESGVFVDDQVTLSLVSVEGPGHFFLYHTDALGIPVVSMNTADGIDGSDARVLMAGSHTHANWVFTTPGTYRIGLQASGVLASDQSVAISEIAEYRFEVEPLRVEQGHVGIRVAYQEDQWTLQAGHAGLGIRFAPDQVRWVAKPAAVRTVPDDARYAFLGATGAPVWILPEIQDPDLLWPGFGLQAVPGRLFTHDEVTIGLLEVEGPGDLFLYRSDPLGHPVVAFNTRDGIDENDVKTLKAGSHVHVSWAFTQPGAYRVSLQASAVFPAGGESISPVTDYFFEVNYAPMLRLRERTGDSLTWEWLSRGHHEYHLESTSDPVHGPWEEHPGVDPMEGDGNIMSVEVQVGNTPRFFRLEIHEEHGHGHHQHHD